MRVVGGEKQIELGRQLLVLRSAIPGNCAFGRAVRLQFEGDAQECAEAMNVAQVYGERPEIYRRLSWHALSALASPTLSPGSRAQLEARIIAGERIGAAEIRAARGGRKFGTAAAVGLGCLSNSDQRRGLMNIVR